MNFYKHHIGDYTKKTGHLSIAEHGAYLLMLQTYYATEKPLPTGRVLYRLLRAETKIERDAVDSIIEQFWTVTSGGLTNGRADEEIELAWVTADQSRANGKKGGRPKNETRVVKEIEPTNNPSGYSQEPEAKAIQTPDSTKIPKEKTLSGEPPPGSIHVEPESDPRKALWDIGVSLLGEGSRSIIGMACKRIGPSRVGEILGTMAAKPPADPKTYFLKATQERGIVV